MRHPLTNNHKLFIAYAVFWGIIASANLVIKNGWYDVEFLDALVDSFNNYILFPILGSSIWYSIKYNSLEDLRITRLMLFHLIGATILIGIWIYLSLAISEMIAPEMIEWQYKNLPSKIFLGYMMYSVYLVFFYAVNYYQSFKEKIKKEGELKALIREAELQALKSQINPHFLFNSLNSISSLTITDPEKAREMVINLSAFMRYSLLHGEKEKVKFSRELENIQLYLGIEKVRFGSKLNMEFEIEDCCMDAEIPNMILQPLYENAIKYGVYETTNQVTIRTVCKCLDSAMKIRIINDYDSDSVAKKGEGIGLRNIRQRMEIIYKNSDLLKVTDHKTSFEVELTIPQK